MATTPSNRSYFGQNGKIRIKRGTTSIDIGVIQNWKVNVTFETNDLYGMGSVYRQGAARHNGKIEVGIEYCGLHDNINGSLAGYIIDPIGGTGDTTSIGADTTNLAMFEMEGEFISEDGQRKVTITVSDVYFASFPWEASTGEWIKMNLEGTGKSYKIESADV